MALTLQEKETMKKERFALIILTILSFMGFQASAQKGVWVPAGGDINGFQIATGLYQNNLYVSAVDYQSGMPKTFIRKFNGTFWTTLVEIKGYNNSILALKEFNGELYVGGQFIEFEGVTNANGLVKWNGKKWSAVGAGFDKGSFPQINALEVYNSKLYVGGRFDSIAGVKVKNLAVWDGSKWSKGPKCEAAPGNYSIVQSLKTFNSNLFIGGSFSLVDSVSCSNVARYDGSKTYALSNGAGNGANSEVAGFEIFKNELYMHGYFNMLDTIRVSGIARWNNTRLLKLQDEPSANVQSIKTSGNFLYAAGAGFNSVVEYFDGTQWQQAGKTALRAEGAEFSSYRNRLYVFSGFMTADSSAFLFAGSAMLLDSSDACLVEGTVFNDADKSCTQGSGEKGLAKRMVEIKPLGVKALTDTAGKFTAWLERGSYAAKLLPYSYYSPSCSDSFPFTFSAAGQKVNLEIGSYIKDTVFDAGVKISSGNARPGFAMQYSISVYNSGTAAQNCVLKVVIDPNYSFSSVRGKNYDRYSGNTLEWDLTGLKPNEVLSVALIGNVRTGTPLGTVMKTVATVTTAASDAYLNNNSDTAVNFVRGSFDPNDKQVYPAGKNGFVGKNTNLTLRYTIRFQNTGTDTAFTVIVSDSLSKDLEISTFEAVSASHPYTYEWVSGNVLRFTFKDILLPDSGIDEPSSHGFVSFDIRPRAGLTAGSKIRNNADIYFDFNDPVRTNTTVTTFDNPASIRPDQSATGAVRIYPNPGKGLVTVELTKAAASQTGAEIKVYNAIGKEYAIVHPNGEKTIELNLQQYADGLYYIKVSGPESGMSVFRYIKSAD